MVTVEGIFNVEVVSAGDPQRKQPAGMLLLAGPPGGGETCLAELGAERLDRPFLCPDMSAYGVATELDTLIGSPPVCSSAKPGILTHLVSKNPNALLLFTALGDRPAQADALLPASDLFAHGHRLYRAA